MNKKLLMLLAAGALVITGCAGKEASKTSDQKNNPEQKETPPLPRPRGIPRSLR